MESNKEILFKVEENHRGKWQPLKKENGDEKTVRITEEQAEILNRQSAYHRIRYVVGAVEEELDSDLEDLKVEYEKVVGKKPHHLKSADKIKAEIEEAKK